MWDLTKEQITMGMAASQSRLLTLTARLSDLELEAQSISNARIRLSQQTETAANEYSTALDKEYFQVYSGDTSSYMDATARNLTSYQGVSSTDKQRFIKDSSGKVVVTEAEGKAYDDAGGILNTFLSKMAVETNTAATGYDASKVTYYTNIFNEIKESGGYNSPGDSNLNDKDWLSNEVSNGNVYLYEYDTTGGTAGTGDFTNVSWTSGDNSLREQSDTAVANKAEAKYEATLASIQSKDKKLELNINQINTEHTAIQTEIESVKKVIDKNIERSFKIFDA